MSHAPGFALRVALPLGSVLAIAACTDDARVLWEREPGPTSATAGVTGAGAGGNPTLPQPTGGNMQPFPVCGEGGPLPDEPCECPPEAPCFCSFVDPMPPPEVCTMLCPEGGCQIECLEAFACDAECGQGCDLQCGPGVSCTLGCAADCTMVCEQGAICSLWSWDGPSQIYCAQGATCECALQDNCVCSGPGCPL